MVFGEDRHEVIIGVLKENFKIEGIIDRIQLYLYVFKIREKIK